MTHITVNESSPSVCLIGNPGDTTRYQGDFHFNHRLALALFPYFNMCLIAPRHQFVGVFEDIPYKIIDINDTEEVITKLSKAKLIIKCPLVRADIPDAYLSIIRRKTKEKRYLTMQEYCIDEHYINETEANKPNDTGKTRKADILTGLGPGRLGIFISPPAAGPKGFAHLHDRMKLLTKGYPEKALKGFAYGHTKSLGLFPWLVSQVVPASDDGTPMLVILIVGKAEGMKMDDLKKLLREMHTDSDQSVVFIDDHGIQEEIAAKVSKKPPLHILMVPAPIPPSDMRMLQTITTENGGVHHATGDQSLSDLTSETPETSPVVYEVRSHKVPFFDSLTETSKIATGTNEIFSILTQYTCASIDLSHLYPCEQEKGITHVGKAKGRLSQYVIPQLKEANDAYRKFFSYLRENCNLGRNMQKFVAQKLGIPLPRSPRIPYSPEPPIVSDSFEEKDRDLPEKREAEPQLRDRPEINAILIEEKNRSDLEDFSAAGIASYTCKRKSSRDEWIFPSRSVAGISGRSLRSSISDIRLTEADRCGIL